MRPANEWVPIDVSNNSMMSGPDSARALGYAEALEVETIRKTLMITASFPVLNGSALAGTLDLERRF